MESSNKSFESLDLLQGLDEQAVQTLKKTCDRLTLAGGETLMTQGDPGDCLYFVSSGRLRFFTEGDRPKDELAGEIGAGETVGEMALITDEPRSASVCAIRDSELHRVSRHQFEQIFDKHPQAMMQLARMIIRRQRTIRPTAQPRTPTTIAMIPLEPDVSLVSFVDQFGSQLSAYGSLKKISFETVEKRFGIDAPNSPLDSQLHRQISSWMNEQEINYQHVLFECLPEKCQWNQRCVRQADAVILVGQSDMNPELTAVETCLSPEYAKSKTAPRMTLVLVHSNDQRPQGTERWLKLRPVDQVFHVRSNSKTDVARVARSISDRANGVVLSGGGARGFAHIGVLQALVESDTPIDMIGGCSMGAIIAAQFAAGWDIDSILQTTRKVFVESGSLFDFTIPIVSLIAGRKGERLMAEVFGQLEFEDLWRPYFCVTSNLSNAHLSVNNRGLLWPAVYASASLPGVVPPRVLGGELHCDGGVLDNLPVNSMRQFTRGPVLAIDVGQPKDVSIDPEVKRCPTGGHLFWRKMNPFVKNVQVPSILAILHRSAVLTSIQRTSEVKETADLYVQPSVERYKIFDFKAIEQLVQCGYEAMSEKISNWKSLATPPAN